MFWFYFCINQPFKRHIILKCLFDSYQAIPSPDTLMSVITPGNFNTIVQVSVSNLQELLIRGGGGGDKECGTGNVRSMRFAILRSLPSSHSDSDSDLNFTYNSLFPRNNKTKIVMQVILKYRCNTGCPKKKYNKIFRINCFQNNIVNLSHIAQDYKSLTDYLHLRENTIRFGVVVTKKL